MRAPGSLLFVLLSATLVGCSDDASGPLDPARAQKGSPTIPGSSGSTPSDGGAPRDGGAAPGDGAAPTVPCTAIVGATYDMLSIAGAPSDRPAASHADVNLGMRKFEVATGASAALVDIAGPTDGKAPKLSTMFSPARAAQVAAVYRVQNWDWGCNCGKGFVTDPEVTLVDLGATPGEVLHMPSSGYDIGGGHGALVLYATPSSLTVKLTRDDNVVNGYALHFDRICVDPALVAAYTSANAAGRGTLPALRPGQAFGRASSAVARVAVRDTGAFMDPRSRKDWW